jgi:protein-tyrosine-phosphatase
VLPEAVDELSDPYYGTDSDYEAMLDLVEAATPAWIAELQARYLKRKG